MNFESPRSEVIHFLFSMNNTVHLQTASILNVPLQNYEKDFTFIVNGEKFKTCKFVADILSSKISKMRIIDPTFNEFIIDIPEKGDFTNVLDLVNFNAIEIPKSDTLFIYKILQILETKSIDVHLLDQEEEEITMGNIFDLILKHEKHESFFSNSLNKEIDFISENFFELDENHKENLEKLSLTTLSRIFENSKLHLRNENQLLNIVNYLYKKDPKYSVLYGYIIFTNVDLDEIDEFIQIFDVNDITTDIWQSIAVLLKQKISKSHKTSKIQNRYNKCKEKIPILYEEKKELDGVINYLRNKSNNNVSNKVIVTSSSCLNEIFNPCNVLIYDDKSKYFLSENKPDAFICFDFKKKKVIPTNYTIRSAPYDDGAHPKSWAIEGSNDNENWNILDTQDNCSKLKGLSLAHTFDIKNNENMEFRYIRMRQTDQSFAINNYLRIESFEIYGYLI